MRVFVILIGSVLVVLAGCVQLNTSARFPGGNPFPAGRPTVELGEPSPNGFDEPAAAHRTFAPTPPESVAPGGPSFEGPALLRQDVEGRRDPARGRQRSGFTTLNRPSLPWTQSFQSTQRRPISALRAGTGPHKIMLISSLHGDEPVAVALMDRMAGHARDNSQQWDGGTVLFVRTPNPDGLAAGTRTNSRGVDLNRNFPTRNFRPNRRQRTGPRPGSEVETQAVLRLLYAYRPSRVVHLKSTTDETGWVLYSRRAAGVVREFAGVTSLRFGELRRGAIAGSLENYAADVLALEQITIAVPGGPNADADALWREYGDVLLKAVGATAGPSNSPPFQNLHAPAPPIAGNQNATAGGLAAGNNPAPAESESEGVPQIGYFELPPPPDEDTADGP